MSEAIEPFRVHVPDSVLADLRERLARTRLPDQLDGAGWGYGTELGYLEELLAWWRERFDWRKQEAALAALPHFRTAIDGVALHFVHARSPHPAAFPLVITHGWPGSIFEFTKILGPLTDPTRHGGRAEDAFHVVCPSIPGYGFSEPPRTPGWDALRMAEVNAKLMARLGYARYGAQGGDWGAIISTHNALVDPSHCAGIHLNMVVAFPPAGAADPTAGLDDDEKRALADLAHFQKEETGYQQIQGTKPQTLGYALNDSPAGLAAWIVEKFRTWSDCDGDVEKRFTKDELLTNVMIYWVTGSITSSTRLYYETIHSGRFGPAGKRVETPTGCAIFPKELYRAPRTWAEAAYNVQQWTKMPRGGHFAALEEPELLVEDVRRLFRTLR
jgi:pimeloyl-ACP methyl ester carboxylesterase